MPARKQFEARGGLAPAAREFAWWNLSYGNKAELQRQRLAGRFGGATAAGVGRAPYFWSQEYGNPKAAISPQRFARRSWEAFRRRANKVIAESVRDALSA